MTLFISALSLGLTLQGGPAHSQNAPGFNPQTLEAVKDLLQDIVQPWLADKALDADTERGQAARAQEIDDLLNAFPGQGVLVHSVVWSDALGRQRVLSVYVAGAGKTPEEALAAHNAGPGVLLQAPSGHAWRDPDSQVFHWFVREGGQTKKYQVSMPRKVIDDANETATEFGSYVRNAFERPSSRSLTQNVENVNSRNDKKR